ncbi:MAG TPA: ABC transporter ATP-binding protein [Dehalococcoidia bacterium]|nr:ABC transporter ATP-binding protein [Dehalococcoidia bacterium]
MTSSRVDGSPLVDTNRLLKRYPSVTAIDNLDLELEAGVIGLAGANGAGKSTLIKILLGLMPPDAGGASIMGLDVATEGTTLRQRVGYMPEHDCLPLDMNATEFVVYMAEISGLPRTAARERTAEILRHVGLFEARYRSMAGYSTGMRQRVKLAQALVHDPDFVLLDEPTNGLDPAGRDEMLELIQRTGETFGISVLMATHLLGEIERVCEELVVLDGGKLVHQGQLARFTSNTETLEVEVEGDAPSLAESLSRSGIDATVAGQTVLVTSTEDPPFAMIRDAVVELDLGLIRMKQRRRMLEDLFRPQQQSGSEQEAAGEDAGV